jgi:crotonobetainyl-CoA:carnitine CoA-transferase CaiB-like acyl-CoA transferase
MTWPGADSGGVAPTPGSGYLGPYRVLDLTDERGLLAGRLLADLGAEVIQVEPVSGSSARALSPRNSAGDSLVWEAYARNKKGVTCALDTAAGRHLFLRLVAVSDFVIDSAEPGRLEELGLSFERLAEVNPRVIQVSIHGFGAAGPKSGWAVSDLVLWAAGGALFPHRQLDRPPVRPSAPQAFLLASCDAACAALIAHFAREGSGAGTHVEVVAQQSVALTTLGRSLAYAVGDEQDVPEAPVRPAGTVVIDTSLSGCARGRSNWPVADGFMELHLAIGPAGGPWTNRFVRWLADQGAIDQDIAEMDWSTLPERLLSGEIDETFLERARAAVGAYLARHTKRQILDAALARRFIAAPILTTKDLAESPQLRDRDFWFEVTASSGKSLAMPGPYGRASNAAFTMRRPAPGVGQHNEEVYRAVLGLDPSTIEALTAEGAI